MNDHDHEITPARPICLKCGIAHPLTSFHRDSRRRDGRQSTCRDCRGEAKRVAEIRAEIDAGLIPAGTRQCTRCGAVKFLSAFPPRPGPSGKIYARCRNCHRLAAAEYKVTEAGKAAVAAYRARPDVKARERERLRQRHVTARHSVWQRAYRATPLGKLITTRSGYRTRLRRTTDPERRAGLERVIAAHDAEIARLRAMRDAEANEVVEDDGDESRRAS